MQPRFFVPSMVAFFTTFTLAIPASAEEGSGSFQPTMPAESRGTHDPQLPGSGSMHEADRTGTTAPSGSVTALPETGAVNATARVAKPTGDYAVTENDRALAARIRVSLEGDPRWVRISEDSLHIRVDNGMVTLQGQVATDTLKTQIGNQVKNLSGVQSLDNQLQVAAAKTDANRR